MPWDSLIISEIQSISVKARTESEHTTATDFVRKLVWLIQKWWITPYRV